MSKVIIVAHPTTGALFTATANPKFVKTQLKTQGGFRVQNGVIAEDSTVCFPLISASAAKQLEESGLKSGDVFPIEGKIVRQLSKTPFYPEQKVVLVGAGGENERPALIDGAEYYQQFQFTADLNAPNNAWYNAQGQVVVESMNLQTAEEKAAQEAASL
jgi:hypothetical protein